MKQRPFSIFFILLIIMTFLFMFACTREEPLAPQSSDMNHNQTSLAKKSTASGGIEEGTISPVLADLNRKLKGKNFQVSMAEWITDAGTGEIGQTVYANNRTLRLDHHWVPGDPNREGRTNITYMVDQTEGATTSGLTGAQTELAIDRAMNTWENVTCSTIPIEKQDFIGIDLGYVQWVYGFGGVPGYAADITHAGWLPGAFFDILAPGGSGFILGVTFTFIWLEGPGGPPTDMDNNGKLDVAFREIYYNDAFPWAIGSGIDVETIALHEVGHGLSQGHFGKIFRTLDNGKLHFSPYAVMNAAYSRVQHTLTGTDNAGHCSIWGSWPNN